MKKLYFFLIALLMFSGCSFFLGNSTPSAQVVNVAMQDLSLSNVKLLFDLDIQNPYSVPLPLTNLEYSLASQSTPFLSGKAESQGMVSANSSKIVQLPVTIGFVELLKVLSSVKPGAVIPYNAQLNLSVDAPAIGPLNLPIRKEGVFPIPAIPSISFATVKWGELSLQKAEAIIQLKITNTNDFAVDMTRFSYNIQLADTPVAQSTIEKATSFVKNEEKILEIPISISPISLGLSFFQILKGAGASYNLDGNMDCNTPFGKLNFPIQTNGNTKFEKKP